MTSSRAPSTSGTASLDDSKCGIPSEGAKRRSEERSMIDPELAKSIRLVGFDIDGVMTDGGVYLGDVDGQRVELKRYDIQDGLGVGMLRRAGIRVAILTGRVSESVRLRAEELNVDDLAPDPDGYKLGAFHQPIEKHDIDPRQCPFVGDDFPDLALLRIVGLP